ncbi:MAG: DUF2953 domain-containing protein [Clostridiales bacterium]|nr:DUF2953 domain-containing protein [Clostridiales bacterium]
MIIAAAILAFLILICFLRVRLLAQYDEDGFILSAYVGPFRKRILPDDKKKQRKEKKEKARESVIKAGRLESLKAQLPSLKQALSRLKRKLLIKELSIHYMAAGADPAATAMYFGAASAGYGMILPLIENNFNIKNRDLRTSVSFEAAEPYIYVKAILSLAVWEAVYVVFGVVKNMVKSENMRAKIRKAG